MKGAFFTIQNLPPLINDGGSIILNAGISAHTGMTGRNRPEPETLCDVVKVALSILDE